MGHNGEAAPHVCVPANEVSDLIFLLYRMFASVLKFHGVSLIDFMLNVNDMKKSTKNWVEPKFALRIGVI